jgi:hypothetical protein
MSEDQGRMTFSMTNDLREWLDEWAERQHRHHVYRDESVRVMAEQCAEARVAARSERAKREQQEGLVNFYRTYLFIAGLVVLALSITLTVVLT